jgi:hypothetical protein
MFRGVEITSGKEAGKPADSAAPYISNLIL